jgi:hypothetical protein
MKYFVRLALTPLALIAALHLAPAPTFAQDAEVRTHRRHRRRPEQPLALVRRRRLRQRLEDRQQRHHIHARLRQRGLVLHRMPSRWTRTTPMDLGRHRREQLPALRVLRRRRLQEPGRRQAGPTSACPNPSTSAASPSIRATPTSSTSRPRAHSGAPAATAACTRPPTAAHLGAHPPRRRRHRRQRGVARSPRSRHHVRLLYQRRRHVWTLINGGPGSGIHKSTDGGATWRELTSGLPKVDMGRIGLAISPGEPRRGLRHRRGPARRGRGLPLHRPRRELDQALGLHVPPARSTTTSSLPTRTTSTRVYSLDTILHVTTDGGATFERVNVEHKHVDDHALWLNPDDARLHADRLRRRRLRELRPRRHLAVQGEPAHHPVLPRLRRHPEPFYFVYGGTQDNNTLGGPSRTLRRIGHLQRGLVHHRRRRRLRDGSTPPIPTSSIRSGSTAASCATTAAPSEIVDIQPQEAPGEPTPTVWNWDSPL